MTGTELVARSSTDLATAGEWTADRIALAFLAGYSGATRAAYACDLADWATFCRSHGIDGLHAERAHVDLYALDLAETRGLSRSTVARRLAALSGYYGRAVEEEVITRSPISHVRRPRVSDESVSTGLDKTELRSLIDAAKRTDRAATRSSAFWLSMGCASPRRATLRSRTWLSNAGTTFYGSSARVASEPAWHFHRSPSKRLT